MGRFDGIAPCGIVRDSCGIVSGVVRFAVEVRVKGFGVSNHGARLPCRPTEACGEGRDRLRLGAVGEGFDHDSEPEEFGCGVALRPFREERLVDEP